MRGFVGLLQVAFIVLKLMEVITWSWWLVMSPMIVSLLLILILVGVPFLLVIIAHLTNKNN